MGARIQLPRIKSLPSLILFHREQPDEPQVVLQVPNADRTDAETYVLRMDSEADVAWLESLRGAQDVKQLLGYCQHVALCPQTGFVRELADLDEPTQAQLAFAMARQFGGPQPLDRVFANRSRRQAPRTSPLRRMLGSRLAW